MVLIFGWGGGDTKDLGEVAPTTCPRCRNRVFLHRVTSNKQFSLYFVPLASYGGTEYLLCPICRNGLQVQPKHKSEVDAMSAATRAYRKGVLRPEAYQGRVDRFWAALGVDAGGTQVLQASPTVPPPVSTASGVAPPADTVPLAEQLAQLAELRNDGVLTEEEFTAMKRRLLGSK